MNPVYKNPQGSMERTRLTRMSFTLLILMSGCAFRGNTEVLEAQLRLQEDQLVELETDLQKTRSDLNVSQRESNSLRNQLTSKGEKTLLPEQADVLYRVERIRINKLLTAGADRDDKPGDDVLTTLITPQDEEGDTMKVPGTVEFALLDLSLPEENQRIGYWTFPAKQTREHWHSGFAGSGYRIDLPWQETPKNEELLLHVRFTTTDGRQFDTNQTVRIERPDREATLIKNEEPTGKVKLRPSVEQPLLFQPAGEPATEKEASPFRKIP
jgi:hypothetical protein